MSEPDLLVIGGGVAGWTAARRAQQLGLSVAVYEKHHEGPGFGNGRLSGGWFHAAKRTPSSDPELLYETIMAKTDGIARPDVARAWAQNVGRAFEFLRAEGGRFEPLDDEDEERQNALIPQRPARLGQAWQGAGPDNLLTAMWRRYTEAGGAFFPKRRAKELVIERGRVVGVRVEGPTGAEERRGRVVGVRVEGPTGAEERRGRSVLLADGGFQGNPELVGKYITATYKLRGSPNDTGDGLLMGLAAGGVPVNMESFYGWPLCTDSLRDDRLWPYPGPHAVIGGGLLVDGHGRRFVDEGLPGERIADAIAKSSTPGNCWAVCDRDVWEGPAREGDVPINPTLADAGGTVVTAATWDELEAGAGLPGGSLRRSVDALHRRVGSDAALEPMRTGPTPTVMRPPFVAVPVVAGITFAMGGLLIDGRGHVLDQTGDSIRGLYAAGGTMGGLQGGPRSGYSGGWSEASTFGLLVAEDAARTVAQSA